MELIQVGERAGVRLDAVNRTRITIGRSTESDVVISDATVSRQHAVIERRGDVWQIRDAGSQNGIHLNGLRISHPTTLRAGDGLTLGGTRLRLALDHSDVAPALVTRRSAGPKVAPAGLSLREQELLTHLAQGMTDIEISQRMMISIRTVRSHLDRIRDKTGARRRPDLTRLALELGLMTTPNGVA
jgi:pSer/pThr/pTyr-binding forkhead associated (FHA) protein